MATLRSLIIDRSPVICRVAQALLTKLGFDATDIATTAAIGLEHFRIHVPRLAIVDAGVTDIPALEVLQQMHEVSAGRSQILYCTLELDIPRLRPVCAAGATGVLIKPFDRPVLAAKLDSWKPPQERSPRPRFFARDTERRAASA